MAKALKVRPAEAQLVGASIRINDTNCFVAYLDWVNEKFLCAKFDYQWVDGVALKLFAALLGNPVRFFFLQATDANNLLSNLCWPDAR